MRMTVDTNRKDRFMASYEANNFALHNRIRELGHSPVSKSFQIKNSCNSARKQTEFEDISVIKEEDHESCA